MLLLALVKQNKIKTVTTETHSLQKHREVLSPKWDICTTPCQAQGTVLESRKNVRGGDVVGAISAVTAEHRILGTLEPTAAVSTCYSKG